MDYQYYVVYHKLKDDKNYSARWEVYDERLKLLFSFPITKEYFNNIWCYYYQGGVIHKYSIIMTFVLGTRKNLELVTSN